MNRLMTKIATAALSAAVVLSSMAPAGAMQMPRVQAATEGDVIQVQQGHRQGVRPFYNQQWGGHWRGGDRGWRGDRGRRHDGWRRGGWERHGWYNGHRGYRGYRHGYRYHNGYWFPLAAFGAGAIIGGALSAPPRATYSGSMSPSHVRWCENRYRSYRAYDNTFQPNRGARRACISPYS